MKLTAALLALLVSGAARADLQVFPTRILLTPAKRVSQVSLRHRGSKTQRYRIAPVFFRMSSDGSLREVEKPRADERYAGSFIRFSPREVVLEPGLEQVVRIMSMPTASLSEGDYRVHLRFEPIDDAEDDAAASAAKGKPGTATMSLKAKVAIAIPVIYRQGNSPVEVGLSQLKLLKGPNQRQYYAVEIRSSPKTFPYGTLKATLIEKDGSTRQVGLIKGISSYLERRIASYPLELEGITSLAGGTLKVEYLAPEDEGNKPLASTQILIQ